MQYFADHEGHFSLHQECSYNSNFTCTVESKTDQFRIIQQAKLMLPGVQAILEQVTGDA